METYKSLLTYVSGTNNVPLDDPQWRVLQTVTQPITKLDPHLIESELLPCWTRLVANHANGNFHKFVHHVVKLLRTCDQTVAYVPASNAICLLQLFFKYIAEKLDPIRLQHYVAPDLLPSTATASGVPPDVIADFVRHALKYLTTTPVSNKSYVLHLELVKLLISMCSTQLYTPTAAGPAIAHPFVELILAQQSQSSPLVQTLLQYFITRPLPPLDAAIYSPPVVAVGRLSAVRSAAASVLRLPLAAYSTFIRRRPPLLSEAPLAHYSLLLFLVLLHHTSTPREHDRNLFHRCLHQLMDSNDVVLDVEDGAGMAYDRPTVPFSTLYNTFGSGGMDEQSAMLLYSLLRTCPQFLEYVLVRSDLDTLLLPILQVLYNHTQLEANHMYMLLIVLLILSQNAAFSQNIHKVQVLSTPWYQERVVSRTSLGSLLVVMLCRTAQYNMFKLKDHYLHTSTLAALTNLAPHLTGLSSLASGRLMALADLLIKHYMRLMERFKHQLHSSHSEVGEQQLLIDVDMYGDCLRMVLEIINIIIVKGLQNNPEMVYALLHKQDVFMLLKGHLRFAELIVNIQLVLDYFNPQIDKAREDRAEEWCVEGVHELLKKCLQKWRPDKLKQIPDLRFTYEEEAAPEEFFVPYVWSLVVAHTKLPWTLGAIALFTPNTLPHYGAQAGTSSSALSAAMSLVVH